MTARWGPAWWPEPGARRTRRARCPLRLAGWHAGSMGTGRRHSGAGRVSHEAAGGRGGGMPARARSAMSRPAVVVLDYGFGNIRSAQRALQRAGADVEVTADPHAALDADGLGAPGVGAF